MSKATSSRRCDAVFIGGGINSLVAAGLLAKKGHSVVVLEQHDQLGGSAARVDLAGGFRSTECCATAQLDPRLVQQLGLEQHGLQLLPSRGHTILPSVDGPGLNLPTERSVLAAALEQQTSAADRDAFADLDGFVERMAKRLQSVFGEPLPDLEPDSVGDVMALMSLGWRLRGLGAKEMPEALRFLPMPVQDVLDERFQHEGLKALIAGPALASSWLGPRSAGSALTLLQSRPAWTAGLLAAPTFVRGGGGALADALAAVVTQHGGEIRLSCPVASISVEDGQSGGRASGLITEAGDEIEARLVVSGVDPKTTLMQLAAPSWLPPEALFTFSRIRSRGSVGIVHLAVDGLPEWSGVEAEPSQLAGRIQIGASLEDLELAFNPMKYGEMPTAPLLDITIPSLTDASTAPEGKHLMHVWVQHVARNLEGGWNDQRRAQLGDLVVANIERHCPGFSAKVLDRQVSTPADLEQRLGLSGGCIFHVEPALDTALFMRPAAGWYQHQTPIENLYLCGPGCHPGGGLTGLPGHNAAACVQRVLEGRTR